jgi:F-type H+-transporting ATPase subunit epsilon
MEIKILGPNRGIYQGESDKITFPGQKGQFQVLENHAPILALLTKGEIVVGENRKIPISSGIVEVADNKVVVLAEEN